MKLVKDLGMLQVRPAGIRKYRFGIYECEDCGKQYKQRTSSIKRNEGVVCKCKKETK